jgi:Zinc carboxypeptidase
MPPAAPPLRPGPGPAPGNYHFHTYDYPNSAAQGPWGLSPAQPQRNGWRFYSMVRDLTGLRDWGTHIGVPNITLTDVGAPTAGGRRTKMLSFGNAGNAANRPTVVITGGIHAREWAATEFTYLLAEYLIRNYPVGAPANVRQTQIQHLVRNRNIRIIPMVNPDGNRRTVFGPAANDRNWRKNRRRLPAWGLTWRAALAPGGVATQPFANVQLAGPLHAQYDVPDYAPPGIPPGAPNRRTRQLTNLDIGVDLNRNMATTGWGYDCGRFVPGVGTQYFNWNPAGDTYFGTGPGTERETSNVQQAMAAAALLGPGGNIAVAIDYHAYGQLILYPSEAQYNGAVTPLYTATGQLLRALIRNGAGVGAYQLGTPLALVHYDATGSVADYATEQYQARSFTIELDPSLVGGGGLAGFQLPENQIQDVFEKNIRGALAAIAAPPTAVQAAFCQITYGWNVFGQGNQVP